MALYHLTVTTELRLRVSVEAGSEEEARQIAQERVEYASFLIQEVVQPETCH
jgi:hypothetical protein